MIAFRPLIHLCQTALDVAEPLVDRMASLFIGREVSNGQMPRQLVQHFSVARPFAPASNRRSINWEGGCRCRLRRFLRQVIDQISALPKVTTRRGWLVIRAARGKKGTMVRGSPSRD